MWVTWIEWATTVEKGTLGGFLCNMFRGCVLVQIIMLILLFGVYMHIWASVLESGTLREFG